ncbi:TPA: hypothetical protein ACF0PM_002128 [Clostridium perfringens]
MNKDFSSLISILQLIGVIVVFMSIAILIFRLIIYKDKVDKRALFMEGSTKILIGVIIIGSLGLIVSVLYGYLLNLEKGVSMGSLSKANLDIASMVKSPDGSDSFLGKLLGELAKSIGVMATSVFGLTPINDLITPDKVTIFSDKQWEIIKACYIMFTFPAIVMMAVMVFKTGIGFLKGAINPKEAEQAKEDLLRWFYVVLMLAAGLLFCKTVIAGANFLTTFLNTSLKNIMPNLNFDTFINNSEEGLFNGLVSLYFAWITLKVNVLFIVRDISLAVFVVFTPIAITLWGINRNVNAFGVWLGELLSNSFMAFFLSLSFTVFSALLITAPSSDKQQFLLLVVGLSLVLKMASVLRNSLQGLMTRLSGIDEDSIAKKFSVGGMVSSALGVASDVRGLQRAGKTFMNGGKDAIETLKSAKDRVSENGVDGAVADIANGVGRMTSPIDVDNFNKGIDTTAKTENGLASYVNKKVNGKNAANAREMSRELKENALNRGQSFDSKTLQGFGVDGKVDRLNNDAIRTNFLDSLAKNSDENPTASSKANTLKSASGTIDQIKQSLANDENVIKAMPDDVVNDPAKKDEWLTAKAENKFNEALFGENAQVTGAKGNRFEVGADGKEHLQALENSNYNANVQNPDSGVKAVRSESLAKNLAAVSNNSDAIYSNIAKQSEKESEGHQYVRTDHKMNTQFANDSVKYSNSNGGASSSSSSSSSSNSSANFATNNIVSPSSSGGASSSSSNASFATSDTVSHSNSGATSPTYSSVNNSNNKASSSTKGNNSYSKDTIGNNGQVENSTPISNNNNSKFDSNDKLNK